MSKEFDDFMESIPQQNDVKGGELDTFKNDVREDDVEKLAEEIYPETYYSGVYVDRWLKEGFIQGYNKAKETYKYTEEDLKLAMKYGYVQGNTGFQGVANLDDLLDLIHRKIKKSSRPTHFECETITMNKGYTDESDIPYQEIEVPKTITNSQGLTQWVGEYIYEQ